MENASDKTFSFGDFELNGAKRTLSKSGETVSLNSKTFDLLLTLVENHGKILGKDELLEKVWEGQFVEENNLTVQISALRKIFGETKNEHKFIATIPGKGYKFIADVRLSNAEHLQNPVESSDKNFSLLTYSSTVESEASGLIGRKREIRLVKNLLLEKTVSLVTLTGAGGSGKTSLALAIAGELKTDFPDGVFFIELAAANQTELVISAVSQALELTESIGKTPLEAIRKFLNERRVLLVLDNFEQVLSAAPVVKEILNGVFSLKILVTSRTALRLNIEREFLVTPLDFPSRENSVSINDSTEFSAVTLFYKRAKTAKSGFVLTDENISAVAEICRRLDGLPLAIELAAARVKLLAPTAILDRLENSLKLLTGGAKDLPERQRTMRGAIRWSYDLLEKEEQILFRRLAIFAGGFTVEAAEYLVESKTEADNEQFDSAVSALDILTHLVENNLLVQKDLPDGNARLQMLEVVREFALEILREENEIDDLRKVHSQFFLAFAEEAETFLHGERGNEWLEKLEAEHDNFRAALDWTLKNDGETAARIAAALRFFWLNHSHLSEGLGWSRAALQSTENSVSKARSDLLLSNGVFLRNQGDFEAARASYQKILTESRKTNDLLQIIKADHGLSAIAVLQKDFTAAQEFIEEALVLSRELKDETQTAYSLCSLADLEMSRSNLSAARPLLEECRTLAENLGNYKLLMTIFFNLGTIEYFANSNETANFHFTESLRIAQEMSNTTMISCLLDGFAGLAAKNGNAEQSANLSGAAESLRESIGYKIEPAEEIFRDDYLAKTRAALDEKTFAAFYEQGKKLNSDEAVALIKNPDVQMSDEAHTEIIIETRSISRITIEDEI